MAQPKRSIFKPRAAVKPKAKSTPDEATVYLYDEIGWFGVQAEQFAKDLAAISAPTIHLRFNSPGGAVFDGMAIHNAIKGHKSRVIGHIDGLCASISSVIAMACDELVAGQGAFIMIHKPWSIAIGDAEALRAEADLLDKVDGQIVGAYAQRSGLDEAEISEMMGAETWMDANEALEKGFIDGIEENQKEKAKATAFDLSVFNHVPDALKGDGKQPPTERELERVLRDAGFSRDQSKSIIANGYKTEDLRDAGDPPTEPQRDAESAPEPPKVRRLTTNELLIEAAKLKK